MKNWFIIFLCCLGCACSSENDDVTTQACTLFEVSKNDVKINNIEGSFTIAVTATSEWSAEVNGASDNWLTLSKYSGPGNGDLRLFFTKNNDATRTAKIVLKMELPNGAEEVVIEVEQLGADPDILLDYPTDVVSCMGDTMICNVISNIDWTVEIPSDCDWLEKIEVPQTRTFQSTDLMFKIAPNAGNERSCPIVVKASSGYELSRTIIINQERVENTLSVEQDEYIVPYRCTLNVGLIQTSPIPYDIETQAAWVSLDKEISTDENMVLVLSENASFLPREAEVTITNGVHSRTVKLFQYGKPDTSIGDDQGVSALAFPGAEGGGRLVTGGRGGEIYHVTNLEDYDSKEAVIKGSLRYGIEKSTRPRSIIFDVSGIIELKRGIYLADYPNVSILGQTAPGDGITIKNYNFSFNLSKASKDINGIVRFIRCRPGDKYEDYGEDGVGGRYFKNAIVDHLTVSWSVDETLSFYGVQNFTAQWCMANESLNNSNHSKGAHGYGGMFSGDNASFHHSLMAHHSSRCPRISDLSEPGTQEDYDYVGYFDVRNNVYYNWSEDGFGCYGGKYATFNIVNCYYKGGPATGTGSMSWRVLSSDPTARAFIDGNYVAASAEVSSDNWTNGIWTQFWRDLNPTEAEMKAMKMDDYLPFSKVTTHDPQRAYEAVLDYAGASLRRDAIDKRIVNEVRTKTTTYTGSKSEKKQPGIIDTIDDTEGYPVVKSYKALLDTDGDGIPDIWETAYGLNPNDASDGNQINTTVDPNGRYSNFEVYCHNLVQHIVYYQNQGGTTIERQ